MRKFLLPDVLVLMSEDVSAGWHQRIASKTAVSASCGLLGGWVYAVLQSGPGRRWAIATSASCGICGGSFSGLHERVPGKVLQESARAARQSIDCANSLFAGGVAAYALAAIQFKCQQRALAMGLVCAGTAAIADMAASALDLPTMLRGALEGLDLLDIQPSHAGQLDKSVKAHGKREYSPEELEAATYQSMAYNNTGTWRDYLPFRKMSEEEWDLYQTRKASKFQERVDKIVKPRSGEKGL